MLDSIVEEAVETGQVEMIWTQMIDDEKVLRKLEMKIEERKYSQRLEHEEDLRQRRLEAQKASKEQWQKRKDMSTVIDGLECLMVGEPKDDWGDDDDDVEEATRVLEEWMIMASESGTLVDDDVDMSNNENEAEAEAEEAARGMEVDEDDLKDIEEMDITEYTKYEDWLEK